MTDRLEGWELDDDVDAAWANQNMLALREIFEGLGPDDFIIGESDKILGILKPPISATDRSVISTLNRTVSHFGNQKLIMLQGNPPTDETAIWVDNSTTPYELKIYNKVLQRWDFLPPEYLHPITLDWLPMGQGGPMNIYKAADDITIQGFASKDIIIQPIGATPAVPDSAVTKVSFKCIQGDIGATRVGGIDRVYAVELLDSVSNIIAAEKKMKVVDAGPTPCYAEWKNMTDMSDLWRARIRVTNEGVTSGNLDIFALNEFGFTNIRIFVEI